MAMKKGDVDDARIVRIGFRIVAKQLYQRLPGLGDKSLRNRLVDVGVSRRSAPLATPRHFAPNDFFCRVCNVRRSVHNRWVHSTKFEQDGREIFRGSLRNDLADNRAPREKDEVEWKLEQSKSEQVTVYDKQQ
jgi:hypothetical protein